MEAFGSGMRRIASVVGADEVTERRTTAWKVKAIELVDETRGDGEGEKWASRVIAGTKPATFEKVVVKVAG
jgi:hypothetical protein